MPRPHTSPVESLEMIELLLFANRDELAARGFELEESPGVREISRTVSWPGESNDERATRERSLEP